MSVTKFSILGFWLLESFKITNIDGVKRDWGQNCKGVLEYTINDKMSVHIIKNLNEQIQPNTSEVYFNSILYYSGLYCIEGNSIIHIVHDSADIRRKGRKEKRTFALEPEIGRLTLTAKGKFGTAKLVWMERSTILNDTALLIRSTVNERMEKFKENP